MQCRQTGQERNSWRAGEKVRGGPLPQARTPWHSPHVPAARFPRGHDVAQSSQGCHWDQSVTVHMKSSKQEALCRLYECSLEQQRPGTSGVCCRKLHKGVYALTRKSSRALVPSHAH